MNYTNLEHDYLVQKGFLKRIKEAMESGIYPDMERGKKLVKQLETQIETYEETNEKDRG